MKPIGENEGRWMFTPVPGMPELHFDKCQACGAWTMGEKALAVQRFQQQYGARNASGTGSCGCTGKR